MDFDRRAAAWLESYFRANGPVHQVAKRFDFDSALLLVKYVTVLGPPVLGEHALAVKEMLETVHQGMLAVEPALSQAEGAHDEPKAGQARDEQARIDQQAKDEQIKKEISDQAGKSAGEIDALKKDFEREQQELTGKLDGMASNYFDKHPDLSDDQRRDATATFNGIKEEALGDLRGQQETRLGELTRAQQEQREELEERRKELDGTRSER